MSSPSHLVSCYIILPLITNPHKGKNKGKKISETDIYKDSDGDGLSDYHEKMIAAGKMHTGSGEALRLCTTMNYLSSDSDGDGLADSEEV